MMPKIVVTQPIHEAVLARLRSAGDVVMNQGPEPWSEEELYLHLKDADAMMAAHCRRTASRNSCRFSASRTALVVIAQMPVTACSRASAR